MIDLHIHSKLSNGELSVDEILGKSQDLDIFSITDSEHCLAYKDINLLEHEKLVTGVIFTSSIDGMLINLIGYEVNPTIINNYYYENNSKEVIEKNEYKVFQSLQDIMKNNGMTLSEDLQLSLVEKGISKKLVFFNAQKHNENFPFLNYHNFYRNGLSNPFSDYFLDEREMHPSIDTVFNLIKDAGGLVFLAHPYEYEVNVDTLIDKLIPYGLDGLEAFHPSAAVRQSLKLLDICEKYNLYASAGSEFRKARYHYPLGVNLHHNIFDLDSFKWLKKYSNLEKENENI